VIAAIGIAVGAAAGFGFERLARGLFENVERPGAGPVVAAAMLLVAAAGLASMMPAARASRVDVLQALRSE
jgi:putative ABC transport system permease protein